MITHSTKETGQQKEQCGFGDDREVGGGWKKFEKREGRQYRVGLHKVGVLAPPSANYVNRL